jgi:hypothetical protein
VPYRFALLVAPIVAAASCTVHDGFPAVDGAKRPSFDCFNFAESWYRFTLTCTATHETRFRSVTAKLQRVTGKEHHSVLAEETLLVDSKVLIPGEAIVLSGFSRDIPRGLLDPKPTGFRIVFDYELRGPTGGWTRDDASFGYGL